MSFIELFIFSLLPSISNKNLKKLKKVLIYETCKKGELLQSEENFYILKSGVIKSTIKLPHSHKQKTNFYISESKSTIINNVVNIPASKNSFLSLTDTEFYKCNFKDFYELVKNEFEISKLHNNLLEQQAIMNEKRIDDLMELNTKERYLKLLKEIPYIEKLIPKYQIANYLNISSVQLTRIRKT